MELGSGSIGSNTLEVQLLSSALCTPLIVHWPKQIAAHGELRRQIGHIVDLMATCVEVSGAKYPTHNGNHGVTPMEGKSLVPAFVDQPWERDYLAWEHEGNKAVRAGQWKLVAVKNRSWELYDLNTDRHELNDLAAQQPERVIAMAAQWDAWARRTNVLPYPNATKKK
jgi:arylsulfatase A-like enzyme